MKLNKIIPPIVVFVVFLFPGCDLTRLPSDGVPADEALNTLQGLQDVTLGNYAYLKEQNDGTNNLVMMMFQPGVYRSDNLMISGTTSNRMMLTYNYLVNPNMPNVENLWRQGYRLIYNCNTVIAAIEPGESTVKDQLLGENKFLRSMMHLYLVTAFARPYSHGRDNLGIPIMSEPDLDARPARNTVGEVYDFIAQDLTEAAELMTIEKPSSYASKEAAYALLTRVYLYMEENEKVIEYADLVFDSGRYELVDTETLPEYFTIDNEERSESIFAIRHLPSDDHGDMGGFGSMIYMTEAGAGWGENYASKAYRDLINQHPEDVRREFIEPQYILDENGNIQYDGNGDPILETRNGFPRYYVTKWTGLGGDPTLNSPEVIRLSEVYLNRAEAYAKLDQDQIAIDHVNTIRQRAGLSGDDLYSVSDLGVHDIVLDVVLEERRLELFMEGHRAHDLFRNHRTMFRDYPGTHLAPGNPGVDIEAGTQTIPADHPRIVFYIPQLEIDINPNLEQNPN